ncbi:MAG: hypothetical protein SOZ59_04410 [Candidatus Limivivens sp.]|nr:hypothetical protein [Candidatus Limivivens sp.]
MKKILILLAAAEGILAAAAFLVLLEGPAFLAAGAVFLAVCLIGVSIGFCVQQMRVMKYLILDSRKRKRDNPVVLTSRVGAAAAGTAAGTEITVLTGVLVGGVSVRGGEGKIFNCVAGVLIMGLLANGMQLAGLNTYYQYVAKGAIMLLVMWFDAFQIKRRAIAANKRKEEKTA